MGVKSGRQGIQGLLFQGTPISRGWKIISFHAVEGSRIETSACMHTLGVLGARWFRRKLSPGLLPPEEEYACRFLEYIS